MADALQRGDLDELAAYRSKAPGMPYAHPTVEHYTPLFIALGAATLVVLVGYVLYLRSRLQAPANNLTQDLYVGDNLKTGRIMVKDEDVCLHCGLCAERCPTGAWDMQKYLIDMTQAGTPCQSQARSAA